MISACKQARIVISIDCLAIESKPIGFFLGQVCQIQADAYHVTLSCIVTFVNVVINNHFVTVVFSSRHILEVI